MYKYTLIMFLLSACAMETRVDTVVETVPVCDAGMEDFSDPDAGVPIMGASPAMPVTPAMPALTECQRICRHVEEELGCVLTHRDTGEEIPCAHLCPDLFPEYQQCLRDAIFCFKAQDCVDTSNIYSSE